MIKLFQKVRWVAVDCLNGLVSKVENLPFEIGSGEGVDLKLNGRAVAERHCAVNQIQGHGLCLVKQDASLPLMVNGEAVEFCPLKPDVDYAVKIGSHFVALRGGRDVDHWLRGLDCGRWTLTDTAANRVDGPMTLEELDSAASRALVALGYTNVVDVPGGMNAWTDSGRDLLMSESGS